MAIGWLAVVSAVPWSQVLEATPKIAAAGRQLWDAIGSNKDDAIRVKSNDSLPAQIEEIKADMSVLNTQLLAASELITRLAEQNTQLVARIENINRRLSYVVVGAIGLTALGIIIFAIVS